MAGFFVPTVSNFSYVGLDDNVLHAYNAKNGSPIWSDILGGSVDISPTIAGGLVYVDASNGTVYALNAQTGATVWTHAFGSFAGNRIPAVANGVLFIGIEKTLYAFTAQTGAPLWTTTITTNLFVYSSPAVTNGVVYLGMSNGSSSAAVYAFDASTGVFLWSAPVGQVIISSPALAGHMMYVSTDDGVYAYATDTHSLLWHTPIGSGGVGVSPTAANGVVYVSSHTGTLYALNASTGAILWTFPLNPSNQLQSSPAVVTRTPFGKPPSFKRGRNGSRVRRVAFLAY